MAPTSRRPLGILGEIFPGHSAIFPLGPPQAQVHQHRAQNSGGPKEATTQEVAAFPPQNDQQGHGKEPAEAQSSVSALKTAT
jgi:hypothetical protein